MIIILIKFFLLRDGESRKEECFELNARIEYQLSVETQRRSEIAEIKEK